MKLPDGEDVQRKSKSPETKGKHKVYTKNQISDKEINLPNIELDSENKYTNPESETKKSLDRSSFRNGSNFNKLNKAKSSPLLSKTLNSPYSQKLFKPEENSKAKFLKTPAGKFRREMSSDHPLAGGTGKYQKELKKGFSPVGLDISLQVSETEIKSEKVSDTIDTANKIERLTYSAKKSVVDPEKVLEKLKKKQNEELKKILEEERLAEEERLELGKTIEDPKEKEKMEQIWADERQRASERIMEATRENEREMKEAVIKLADLEAQ